MSKWLASHQNEWEAYIHRKQFDLVDVIAMAASVTMIVGVVLFGWR